MFSIGWSEIFLIVVVAVFVIGPKELPVMLKQIGRLSRKISRYISSLKSAFNEVIEEEELKDFKKHMSLYDPGKDALGEYAKFYEWDEKGDMKIPDESPNFKVNRTENTEKETPNV